MQAELRNLIPKTGDPDKPFFTKRHREIDDLLCRYSWPQYKLELLKQDIEMTTLVFEEKTSKQKKKKALETGPDLWTDGGDHA